MLTVEALLQMPITQSVTLRAGRRGLRREIRWVHIGEHPDTPEWLEGRELIFTTGVSWPRDPGAQADLMRRYVHREISGILFATRRFIPTVPEPVLQVAEEHGIPVLEDPWTIKAVEFTEVVHREIIRRQYALLERSDQIHRSLTAVAVRARGLQEIAAATAGFLRRRVIIENKRRQRLADALPPVEEVLSLEPPDEETAVRLSDAGTLYPICAGQELLGYLRIEGNGRPLSQLEVRAAEHAATVMALHLVRERAVQAERDRLRAGLVESLVSGLHVDRSLLSERVRAHGVVPEQPCLAGVVSTVEAEARSPEFRRAHVLNTEILHELEERLNEQKDLVGLASLHTDKLIFVCSIGPGADVEAAMHDVYENLLRCCRQAPLLVTGGIKPCCWDLADSYREALDTLRIVSKTESRGGVFLRDKLGLRHLLLCSLNSREVGALRRAILRDLASQDSDGYLMRTLRALVEHDFEMGRTAAVLRIHRNTLRYRLQRLEEAIGMPLSQEETRFWLRLALELGPLEETRQTKESLMPLRRHHRRKDGNGSDPYFSREVGR